MMMDKRFAIDYPEPDHSLEFAARLLAACPNTLVNLKTPKEIFDKTVELADMFYAHLHRNDPPKHEYTLSGLPSNFPEQTDQAAPA